MRSTDTLAFSSAPIDPFGAGCHFLRADYFLILI
jgi:hypothetical protein